MDVDHDDNHSGAGGQSPDKKRVPSWRRQHEEAKARQRLRELHSHTTPRADKPRDCIGGPLDWRVSSSEDVPWSPDCGGGGSDVDTLVSADSNQDYDSQEEDADSHPDSEGQEDDDSRQDSDSQEDADGKDDMIDSVAADASHTKVVDEYIEVEVEEKVVTDFVCDELPLDVKLTCDEPPLDVQLTSVEPPFAVKLTCDELPLAVKLTCDEPPLDVQLTCDEPPLDVQLTCDEPPFAVKLTCDEPPLDVQLTSDEPRFAVKLTCDELPLAVQLTSDEPPFAVKLTCDELPLAVQLTYDEPPLDVQLTYDEPPLDVQLTCDEPPFAIKLTCDEPSLDVQLTCDELPLIVKLTGDETPLTLKPYNGTDTVSKSDLDLTCRPTLEVVTPEQLSEAVTDEPSPCTAVGDISEVDTRRLDGVEIIASETEPLSATPVELAESLATADVEAECAAAEEEAGIETIEVVVTEDKTRVLVAEEKRLVIERKKEVTTPDNFTPEEIVAVAAKEEEIACANKMQEDKEMLLAYVAEMETKYRERTISRKKNATLDKLRPEESFFTGLDSSLKKNTAFVRKVKSFTANQMSQILSDLRQLNLTKYTSEVAAAIVEAKLKMTDVDTAVQLCVLFHQTYADFSGFLLENWQKVLAIKKDDKNINASKLRVDLRFYAECINYGVFTNREGLPILGNVLTVLINMDKEEHNNVNVILNFCRHCGDDFAGLVPAKIRKLSGQFNIPIPRSELLPKEKQKNVRTLLKDYFTSLSKHYVKVHRDLQAFLRQNRRILQTKGELSADRKAKQDKLETTRKRLRTAVESFAEQLDEAEPDLPKDESLKLDEDPCTALLLGQSGGEGDGGVVSGAALWEDEEMRRFYEQLPDMREYVPALAHRTPAPPPAEPPAHVSEEILDAEIGGEEDGDLASKEELPPMFEDIEEPESTCNASNKIVLDAYLNMLQNCVNREMIDTASVDFVMKLNTKFNRKKLTKLLFNVPRIRLDLLPFYSRLVANLYPVVPEVANDLAMLLKHDFKYHIRKKDQINIESKVKNVRFIGELVKFRVYTKTEALYCVKVLLHDFTHHHIEMCCNLLETCGRFLFRHPDTHQRTKVYLEQMMRKKCVMALDARYVTMIENVFYYVNPPEGSGAAARKVRPPLHELMRRLLYQDLAKNNTDRVLRLMRKFDWDQAALAAYAVKCLTYAFNVKYYNIPCLANLLAGLVIKEDFVGTHVVDAVLEDIRLGLEVNAPKYNQRRVAMIKYLGELYNYRMVESGDIFKVLYLLITFGVTMDYNYPSQLDPSDNLIRIRLVCVLLDTCGQYFTNGATKKKLDYFFIFFQNYFLFKRSDPYWAAEGEKFPFGIETIFRESLISLRPQIHFMAALEESQKAISEMHAQLASEQPEFYQLQSEDRLSASPTGDYGCNAAMDTIAEGDDENSHNTAEDSSKYCEARGVDGQSSGDEGTDQRDDLDDDDADVRLETNVAHSDNEAEDGFLLSETEGAEYHPRGVVHIECPEDDDFMSNFDRMVSDNIHDRMRETVKPQQVDISVPLHVKSHSKKSYDQLCETKPEDDTTTNFILMLRKGNKPQYKTLSVPVDSELALNLRDQEEAEKIEKERVKRLTLNINERLEEEDYQEMMAQSPKPMIMNLNRERRPKYQHPRGAPDADLIFGSKRISKSSLQPM